MSWFETIWRVMGVATQGARRDEAVRLRSDLVRLCHENRFTEAAKVAQELVEWQRAAIGEAHPDFASGLLNLARILHKQGDHPEAIRVVERAASLRRTVLGADHPDTVEAASLADAWRIEDPPTFPSAPASQAPTPEPAGEPPGLRETAERQPGLILAISELSEGGG